MEIIRPKGLRILKMTQFLFTFDGALDGEGKCTGSNFSELGIYNQAGSSKGSDFLSLAFKDWGIKAGNWEVNYHATPVTPSLEATQFHFKWMGGNYILIKRHPSVTTDVTIHMTVKLYG